MQPIRALFVSHWIPMKMKSICFKIEFSYRLFIESPDSTIASKINLDPVKEEETVQQITR